MAEETWDFMVLYEEFRNNGDEYQRLQDTIDSIPKGRLDFAESCLLIGCGQGIVESYFVEKQAPNVKRVVAIEADSDNFKRLQQRLPSLYIGALDVQMVHSKIEDWDNKEKEKFDLCVKQWMKPESLIYLYMLDDTKDASGRGSFILDMFRRLKTNVWIDLNVAKEELKLVGLTYDGEYRCEIPKKLEHITKKTVKFISYYLDPPRTEEEIEAVLEELKRQGYEGRSVHTFLSVRKQ